MYCMNVLNVYVIKSEKKQKERHPATKPLRMRKKTSFFLQKLTLSSQSWEDGLHGNLFLFASALLFDKNTTKSSKSGAQAVL
jgi:hypothetical protein